MAGNRDGGHDAVSWLATGVVSLMGIIFSGFVVLAFANDPQKPVMLLAGVFLSLAVLMWLLREKPKVVIAEKEAKWLGIFAKPKVVSKLRLTRRKKPKIEQFGTNEPPDAERIREIKELTDGMKNWVPPKTDPDQEAGLKSSPRG
ncbi:MAG: hypothetical protein NT013_07600 [Planctomycetia bacterium]|nr:hypothetical protein [Planctomycetia bacterium]